MNILQIINVRWFNAEAAYAYSLTKSLIKKGHKTVIVGLPGSPVIKKAKEDEIVFYETSNLNSYNPAKVFKGVNELVCLINREEVDVINCHRSEGYPMIALAAKLSGRRPVLVRTRGDVRPVRGGFNKLFYTRLADEVIASGGVIKHGLIKRLKLDEDRVDVIYAAVDINKFRPRDKFNDVRKELDIPSVSPLIAILGRLGEVKGHKYFIEAVALIVKEYPSARFLVIAKEINEERIELLKRLIADAGLKGKVFFTGFRNDLLDVMASCDIGVVSSIGSEANCRVVLEWMAMGKPVVATTVGVIPEVLKDNETGYLVPPKDSLAIANAVGRLLSDRAKAVAFGNKGRKLAESVYNAELFAEKTLDVYRNAIKHHRGV